MITHEDKISFYNAVNDYLSASYRLTEANREAVALLSKNVMDLTEDKMKEVLWKIKRWDTENENEIEAWMQRLFS